MAHSGYSGSTELCSQATAAAADALICADRAPQATAMKPVEIFFDALATLAHADTRGFLGSCQYISEPQVLSVISLSSKNHQSDKDMQHS